MAKGPQPGDAAPDFELEGTQGNFRLSEQRGKRVVILFYPGDNTPVCTKQFCSYRDNSAGMDSLDAVVVGVSPQGLESHNGFVEKHSLNVPLLADTEKVAAGLFGMTGMLPPGTKRGVVTLTVKARLPTATTTAWALTSRQSMSSRQPWRQSPPDSLTFQTFYFRGQHPGRRPLLWCKRPCAYMVPKMIKGFGSVCLVACSIAFLGCGDQDCSLRVPGSDLAGCDLRGKNLSGSDLTGAKLNGANLKGAVLTDTKLDYADLSGAKMDRVDLAGAHLRNVNFSKATMVNSDLKDTVMNGANFDNANLSRASLRGATLFNSTLNGANLSSADMSRLNLNGAALTHATLTWADLSHADLYRADLTGTTLKNVNLCGTKMPNGESHPCDAPNSGPTTGREARPLSDAASGQQPDAPRTPATPASPTDPAAPTNPSAPAVPPGPSDPLGRPQGLKPTP